VLSASQRQRQRQRSPMEYTVEMNRLTELQMEFSIV
jgi:Fe-S cluster assembly scaffold protein SufB